jgi:methyl-accepting chemotaxis protein
MNMSTKIILLVAPSLVVVAVAVGLLSIWQLRKSGHMVITQIEELRADSLKGMKLDSEKYREELTARKKSHLKSQVQTAMSALGKFLEDANSTELTGLRGEVQEELMQAMLEEKKERVTDLIQRLRYGPENKDYFWINDMDAKMVMHPYKPELNGKALSDFKDSNGKRIFIEFVKVCREKGEGFVDYSWPKYGSDKPQPKISYVKLFKEWNWVIGTGAYVDDIDAMVDARKGELKKQVDAAAAEMQRRIGSTKAGIEENVQRVLMLIGMTTLILLAVVMTGVFIISRRSIAKPINHVIEALNEASGQVTSASAQVSSASHQLAEGAGNQASSLEETSSALEEMSAMTRQNADNATQADNLMKEANMVVTKANESMHGLNTSMEEILKASEEISEIVKAIDEIAFQTNLLALNAAVEAARAGEAGVSFAVVADEVRNLATRAAHSAKNTADLIEGTEKKVKDGAKLVTTTNEAFNEVVTSAAKVGELVGEIASASNEQAQGIEQVNRAIVEMDKVTQQNAANAEDSASSSEEMNAQAEKMKGVVEDLVYIVSGRAQNTESTT